MKIGVLKLRKYIQWITKEEIRVNEFFIYTEFGKDAYNKVEWSEIDSEMTDGQRHFINGLLS